jgi:hypothetical protein
VGKVRQLEDGSLAKEVTDVLFEVQVRSAFEHAASVATHDLVYKAPSVSWERLRLAAHIQASAEQLDLLVSGFDGSAEFIAARSWSDTDLQRRAVEALQRLVSTGAIPREAVPKDWSRFAQNLVTMVRAGTKSGQPPYVHSRIEQAVECLVEKLPQLAPAFPMSLSLHQVCMGVLASERKLEVTPLNRFFPVVTDDLLTRFPAVAGLGQPFAF